VNPEKLLWAERYDRALGDIVVLQGELAREITNAIRIALNADEQMRLGNVRPVNRDAYEALLKGRYYRNRMTEATTKKAMEYFREAIEKDPSYACFRKPVGCVHKLCAFGGPSGSSSCTRSLSASQGGGQQSSRNRRYPRRSACDSRSHQVSVRPRLG
jgi:Predicted integral membrane protein